MRFIVRFMVLLWLLPAAFTYAQSLQSIRADGWQTLQQALVGASERPVKCGLAYGMAFQKFKDALPAKERARLQGVFQRPTTLPFSYVSKNGHFKIHYATSGKNAVDTTSTNPSGVPDYVFEAARAAERSYFILVDSLGFAPHPPDGGIEGPEYDFYIINLGNVYGLTYSENLVGTNPDRYSAYTEVDNDFKGIYFTEGIDALRVTVAHEYFHAVHFGYAYRDYDIFFFEMSSVWFEDTAYDYVNDYLQYLPSLFRSFNEPLHLQNGWHEYGMGIWLQYWLADREYTSLRRIWERMQQQAALYAIAGEVQASGESMPQAMAEFFSWCLYTGNRAVPGRYFPDARLFPKVRYRLETAIAGDSTITDSTRALSGQFYKVGINPSQAFQALIKGDAPEAWQLSATAERLSGELGESVSSPGLAPVLVPAPENDGTVLLVAANGAVPSDPQQSPGRLPEDVFRMPMQLTATDLSTTGLLKPRPNPFLSGHGGSVLLLFILEESADVRLSIFSEAGFPVWDKDLGLHSAGPSQATWDGKDGSGTAVASGIYFIVLQTSSGLKEIEKIAVIRK